MKSFFPPIHIKTLFFFQFLRQNCKSCLKILGFTPEEEKMYISSSKARKIVKMISAFFCVYRNIVKVQYLASLL